MGDWGSPQSAFGYPNAMLAKPVASGFVPSEPVVFLNHSFSLILLNPSSVVQMIWSLSAMLISVFIVPVVSFPQTTTILHRLNIWWDILRMACISSASPSRHQGMGKSCTASRSAHIPVRRSSGSTAVLWSFLLLQNSRHKQVPVPIRPSPFLAGQVSSARRFSKKKHPQSIPLCGCLVDIWILFFSFSDVCQTSGYCGSLFSASSPASSAMRTRSLPSL